MQCISDRDYEQASRRGLCGVFAAAFGLRPAIDAIIMLRGIEMWRKGHYKLMMVAVFALVLKGDFERAGKSWRADSRGVNAIDLMAFQFRLGSPYQCSQLRIFWLLAGATAKTLGDLVHSKVI